MRFLFNRVQLLALTLLGLAISGAQAEIRQTSVWWLPRNVTMFGHEIDFIFYVILILTGVTAVAVFSTMIYFIVSTGLGQAFPLSIVMATTPWRSSGQEFPCLFFWH